MNVFLPVLEAKASPNTNGQLCEASVDIVMIMDRSGSMGYDIPTRLSQAQGAANNFLGYLGTNDQSALVSYSNAAVLDKGLSGDHALTQAKVSSLSALGATNIGDAIALSNQELGSGNANPQAVKIAILLTDGMANKPNGPGFGEYPADVAYAETKAGEAALLGYKIFTIGLGNSVNGTMLQNIASATNAEYYYAPTSAQLEGIYNQISARICEYGSISGCKYEDTNNDGNILGEPAISGWEINLGGHANATQLTDETGCYQFSGLLPGNYTVNEGGKTGVVFEQTYPAGGSYAISLPEGQNLENYDFGNYLNRSYCGDGVKDNNEQCDDGNDINNDECSNECLINIPESYCGDGNLDPGEQCDDGNNIDNDSCSSKCLINAPEPYCGNGIKEGSEQCDGEDGVGNNQICSKSCKLANMTYCGDGIKQAPNDKKKGGPQNDGYEECDGKDGVGDNQTCQSNCVLLESFCRVNLDTMVVMDISGSMGYDNPTRLSQAKIAANGFLDKLGSGDKSALVAYSTNAELKKPFSNNHAATKTAINNLFAVGATNIGDGIGLANQEFFDNGGSQTLKIEILLTDGKANKPNGYGYGEDRRDVAYAKEKAAEAASKGIKIFTIGLGSSINGAMLYDIAQSTGGQYYFAPRGEDLERIFNDIGFDVCKYGSISGCKYEDSNNDGDITGEQALPEWEINLSGDDSRIQTTNENGCYSFTGLLSGNYNIFESGNQGVDFVQTYPQTLSYDVALGAEEDAAGYDFGNYFPACGNNVLDSDRNEQCDDGNNINDDGCSNECLINIPDPYCGDGAVNNDDEQCDDGNNIDGDNCSSSCSIEASGETGGDGDQTSPVCGDNAIEGDEQCDDGNLGDGDGCSSICETEEEEEENNPVSEGDVVINEIMYNPSIVTDANGEWFELVNTTGNNIDLEGCVISDNESDSHTLASLIIPANGYAVLAKNADASTNGGITPDYVYSSFALGNAGDEIILACEGIEIDRVEYDEENSWPAGVGKSIVLNSPSNDNNNPANWCVSSSAYGDGDEGTPGNQNDSCGGNEYVCGDGNSDLGEECDDGNNIDGDNCSSTCLIEIPASVCGNSVTETGEECDDGNTDDGDGCSSACETENNNSDGIGLGDLIINELMWMGSTGKNSDEWVELDNKTSQELDLSNCHLTKITGGVEELMLSFPKGSSVAADGLYLVSNYTKTNSNISAEPSLVDTAMSLSNSALQVNLYCGGEEWNDGISILIDKAGDGGAPLAGDNGDNSADPIIPRKSMSRKSIPGSGTSEDNWCTASSAVNWDSGIIDLGTPLGVNNCDQTSSVCGDDVKEEDEECDDGNKNDGDGCSSTCQTEVVIYQCSDNIDNDQDGLVDYPNDPGCDNAEDDDEYNSLINLGDIVINEIMYNPNIVTDANGEWFELLNMTGSEINLEGCVISDNDTDSHTLAFLMIPANGYAVLARNADSLINGGITPDYVYSSFTLGNDEDEIILTCEGIEIDRVEYGGEGWPAGTGETIMLDDPTSDNDNPANWSVSTIPYGAGDKGTPGSQNSK